MMDRFHASGLISQQLHPRECGRCQFGSARWDQVLVPADPRRLSTLLPGPVGRAKCAAHWDLPPVLLGLSPRYRPDYPRGAFCRYLLLRTAPVPGAPVRHSDSNMKVPNQYDLHTSNPRRLVLRLVARLLVLFHQPRVRKFHVGAALCRRAERAKSEP